MPDAARAQHEIEDAAVYSEAEAAAILRVRPATLRQWRWRRTGPTYIRMGRMRCYLGADIRSWRLGCRVDPRSPGRPARPALS